MKQWLITMVFLTTLFVSEGNCTCGCFENFIPFDYASVDYIGQDPNAGLADFRVTYYTTCADGLIENGPYDFPRFLITDDCHINYDYGTHGDYKRYCMQMCYPCWCDFPCEEWATHTIHDYIIRICWHGKFELRAVWRGGVLYENTFEWAPSSEDNMPKFLSTQILSYSDEIVNEYAVFDVDEILKFRVAAQWDPFPDEPDDNLANFSFTFS